MKPIIDIQKNGRDAYHLFSDSAWTVDWIGAVNENNLLEQDEKAVITIWLAKHDGDNTTAFNVDTATSDTCWDEDDVVNSLLNTSSDFSIEIKTPKGAVMTLNGAPPAYLDNVMDLHYDQTKNRHMQIPKGGRGRSSPAPFV